MNDVQKIVNLYFEYFCKKDLEALNELYADDVILNEWNSNIFIGKEKVLQANKKLFEEVGLLEIDVKTSGITEDRSVNEIIVSLDNALVKVVDVLQIQDGKIKYIMAYRGF